MNRQSLDRHAARRALEHLAIVLVAPKFPENIGAAARVAKNMGINRLVVVGSGEYDREKMLKMATHKAAALVEQMEQHPDLEAALAPFSWVVGATARQGRHRRQVENPRRMAAALLPVLVNNRAALLFGPEDRGLTNEDLQYCNQITTIPTADFSSLNLAQAVAVLCYEVHGAVLAAGGKKGRKFVARRAENRELEAMYGHIEQALRRVGFLKGTDCAYWMRNIRQFLGRVGLESREARTIRGFCRQLLWYDDQVRGAGAPPSAEPK